MMMFEKYQDVKNEWRWRLKVVDNGKVIADSAEGYINERDCDHGIELVQQSVRSNTSVVAA